MKISELSLFVNNKLVNNQLLNGDITKYINIGWNTIKIQTKDLCQICSSYQVSIKIENKNQSWGCSETENSDKNHLIKLLLFVPNETENINKVLLKTSIVKDKNILFEEFSKDLFTSHTNPCLTTCSTR